MDEFSKQIKNRHCVIFQHNFLSYSFLSVSQLGEFDFYYIYSNVNFLISVIIKVTVN